MGRYRDGLLDAAKIVQRMSDDVMRDAMKYHDREDPDYDRYEQLEYEATLLQAAADKIRKKAK